MRWRFAECELDTDRVELVRSGDVVALEPQVFDVLAHLVRNRDRVVTKEELLDEVWGDRFVSESALTTRIKAARRAVGDDGKSQRVIRTVHGRGYRFVAATTERGDEGSERFASDEPKPVDVSLSVDREFPFVGREQTIEVALQLAAEDEPTALLLGGEPGIGKSRVATEIVNLVARERGFEAIGGRCERHLATSLQPWLEALAPHVERVAADELEAETAGLVPHLRSVLPALEHRLAETGPQTPPRADDYATIDALATLIERAAARRPLVILLDDVQWAGGATRALTSLVMRRGVARALLVLTFRTTVDDLDETTAEWLTSLEAAGATRQDLQELTRADIEHLVARVLPGEPVEWTELAGDIFERSEGHALFAVELIRDLRSGKPRRALPASVAALVQSRLSRLPRSVASLVVSGAAIGAEFELSVAAAAANLTDDEALDSVEIALGAQLLHEVAGRPDWYRFSHQLVPAAALDAISTSRRLRLHARIVSELQDRGASGIEIAHHLLEASPLFDLDEVVARVRSISEAALREHQYDRAVELLERVSRLDVDPRTRAEVLAQFGAACNLAGLQPRALPALERTAALARSHGWDDLFATAALGMWGQSPFRASRDRTVIPLLDEAIARSSGLDDRTRARLLAKRAAFNLFSGPLEERDRLSAEAVALVGHDMTRARLEVLEARWMAIASPVMLGQVVALDEELAGLRSTLGALTTDACAPEITIYWRGMGDELRTLARELADDPRQRRDVDQWRTTALAGAFALFRRDTSEARRLTDRALPLSREPWGEAGQVVHGLVHLLLDVLDDDQGRSPDRWRAIEELVPSDAMRATRAWVEARWGDAPAAAALVAHVLPRVELLAENFMGGFGLVGLSEAVLLLEDEAAYPVLIDILTPLSGQMLGHPWAPSLAAADPLARLLERSGDSASAATALAEARRLYGRLDAPSLDERLVAWFG